MMYCYMSVMEDLVSSQLADNVDDNTTTKYHQWYLEAQKDRRKYNGKFLKPRSFTYFGKPHHFPPPLLFPA